MLVLMLVLVLVLVLVSVLMINLQNAIIFSMILYFVIALPPLNKYIFARCQEVLMLMFMLMLMLMLVLVSVLVLMINLLCVKRC